MDLNSDFNLDTPVSRASTPPASWYVSQEIFNLERDRVFANSWQPVGVVEQLPQPGSYFSGHFMGKPYVVARDMAGELRAFYNVCRHHAAELVSGEGCLKQFSCPYHGWSYSLNGTLMAAPRTQGIEDFEKSEFGLKPISLKTIGPFIWLNFGKDTGPAPDKMFSDVWARLTDTGYGELKFHSRKTYEIKCNWKVYVDNYLDGGYHVGVLHKQLTSQLQLNDYGVEVAKDFSIQTCKGSNSDRIGSGAFYVWLYPNFMINRYGPAMDTNWVIPLGADRCLTVFDFFFSETQGEAAEKFISNSLAMSEQVQAEDIMISESVQRGLESGAYSVGRYAPKVEHAMHAFHTRLARDLRAPNNGK